MAAKVVTVTVGGKGLSVTTHGAVDVREFRAMMRDDFRHGQTVERRMFAVTVRPVRLRAVVRLIGDRVTVADE